MSSRGTASPLRTAHPLARYGWDEGFAESFTPYLDRGLVPGRVVRVDRGRLDVVVADGEGVTTILADTGLVATGDPARVPCTGDWAVVEPDRRQGAFVHALLPRRTAFWRSASSKRSDGQVLAANIDRSVICVSLAGPLDQGRLERFVALAWSSGAAPVVVLTKADLAPDLEHALADAAAVAPGVPVVPVSAAAGEGVAELSALLGNGTSVLLGVSGAGKSTLTNALLGEEVMYVASVRDRDGKGRHTTTTRELYATESGRVFIDTPGLRGVGLWDAGEGLGRAFGEIEDLARQCRFGDCGHRSEPGCAVQDAVADGELAPRRLESYRRLRREDERLAARTDARLRAEQRKEYKRRDADGRSRGEHKRGGHRYGGHRS
ncbi:ribosome small subunit-dependent GTPase A [Streptomyces sp. XM4193]|uniref:ribosome small subunit-dependent GTPase A n=1 Tax=Streptomyces sp. XM4193 TaxID=2929782 RepID=UPI001FFBF80E|nr:ribosome small subunit-dependent GTPase A [Streptomyces sp. XM4193]MCK1797133.1 ribosome small subunit-dependent GTPase A [Streptomyces sp. XM4193]